MNTFSELTKLKGLEGKAHQTLFDVLHLSQCWSSLRWHDPGSWASEEFSKGQQSMFLCGDQNHFSGSDKTEWNFILPIQN